MDKEDKKSFICDYCGKSFTLHSYRLKHIRRIHNKTSRGKDVLKKSQFTCVVCNKQFNYKSSLQRHVNISHLTDASPSEKFSCSVCNYSTARKDDLSKHIHTVHNKTKVTKVKNFKCAYCSSAFTFKNNRRRHEKVKHKIERSVKCKINRKCPLCDFSSSGVRKKEINDHFKNKHRLKMTWRKIHFKGQKGFMTWKNDVEVKHNISFVKVTFISNRSVHYFCNRSGTFKSSGANKRKMKNKSSCKINAHCPCEIIAKTKEDGRIYVSYLPTHVGHKNDLKHLRLRKKVRRCLVSTSSLVMGFHNYCKTSPKNSDLKRIKRINNKDLNKTTHDGCKNDVKYPQLRKKVGRVSAFKSTLDELMGFHNYCDRKTSLTKSDLELIQQIKDRDRNNIGKSSITNNCVSESESELDYIHFLCNS